MIRATALVTKAGHLRRGIPMRARRNHLAKGQARQVRRRNANATARRKGRYQPKSRRCVDSRNVPQPFAPPEDWHEPTGADSYRIVMQEPGEGYRHVLTPQQVRQRLAELPEWFLNGLEVVQFSRITRKKQSFPCYGMQWGTTLYLYPVEESLTEVFCSPPPTDVLTESKMFGGRWDTSTPGEWHLRWSEEAIRDFYLNNILIHELGHLLDERNTSYVDRERYAEWFAIHYGYLRSKRLDRPRRKVKRRHHKV